jgi:hypothetical protein
MENTAELAEAWMEAYQQQHPEVSRFTIPAQKSVNPAKAEQLALPMGE